MRSKVLGHTGEKIPEIGQGTWNIHRGEEALRLGVSLGARLIDTAEMYGTEEAVGRAVEGMSDVFIATKVSAHHLHHDDVLRSAEASLKRLRVKTIDLYQVHWPNPRIPIRETMRAMEELVKAGKVRYVGVSNFSVSELEEAQEALGSGEIVSDQVEYSLLSRGIERELLPYCERQGVTVIAYTPLAHGRLASGRSGGSVLGEVAGRYGKTLGQVALNWLVSRKGVVVIPKSGRIEHVRENVGASGWRLAREDFDLISRSFA